MKNLLFQLSSGNAMIIESPLDWQQFFDDYEKIGRVLMSPPDWIEVLPDDTSNPLAGENIAGAISNAMEAQGFVFENPLGQPPPESSLKGEPSDRTIEWMAAQEKTLVGTFILLYKAHHYGGGTTEGMNITVGDYGQGD